MKLSQKLTTVFGAAMLGLMSLAAKATEKDVIEIAASESMFAILLKAVEAADLTDDLKGEGPFTVFAPMDSAFEELPAGTLDDLLKPENKERLTEILSYHVIPGRYTAENIAGKMKQLTTLQGEVLHINAAGRIVKVDQAAIQVPDVVASNGVIHVIDKVLIPN